MPIPIGRAFGMGHEPVPVPDVPLADTLGNEHLDRLSGQFVAGVTEGRLDLWIGIDDLPVAVDRDDRVGRSLEHRAEALLAVREAALRCLAGRDVDDGRKDLAGSPRHRPATG